MIFVVGCVNNGMLNLLFLKLVLRDFSQDVGGVLEIIFFLENV